ncbi:hypothetical protein KUCAC02_037968, partial [Chaenocephalus aceratus]
QEQCHLLVELMKEYQSLKTSLCSVTDSSETLMDIRSVLRDHEETRRALTKHEALKVEMLSRQQEVEQLSVRGKQLVMELKKIPECPSETLKRDMETLVDHWLDVSEKLDENLLQLNQSLSLWEEVRSIGEEVESWSGGALMELNESLNNLNHSRGAEERLAALRVELLQKEQRLETLQSKVSELRRGGQSEETPARLQVRLYLPLRRLAGRENDSRGNDSRGNDSRGNDSPGNDSRGNDSRGNDSRGNDSRGNDSRGNDSRGNDSPR